MATESKTPRKKVRAECPGCGCGHVGHMTADELKERAAHEDVDLSCPVCGMIHLDREEIDTLNDKRVVDSHEYQSLRSAAEAG